MRVFDKPGMTSFYARDDAAYLLADHLEAQPNDAVLNLNCGNGHVAAAAALLAAEGRIVATSTNLLDAEATRRTLGALRPTTTWQVLHAANLPDLAPVDVVVARLPKGRLPARQLICDAFLALRPGGRLFLAGANDEGIQSALKRVEEHFGNLAILGYRQGARIGTATRLSSAGGPIAVLADPILDRQHLHEFPVSVCGQEIVVHSRPGVFSWDRLDDGARMLAETMEIKSGECLLDLGCGCGVVGVVAARLGRDVSVWLVDSDSDAVESARATAGANGVVDFSCLASDVTSAVRDRRFDVVVANPPFHVGRAMEMDVARAFIRESADVLIPGGRLYLVANAFLPYEKELARSFAEVGVARSDRRYKVIVGRTASGRR